jgi:hypothetical protein
VDAQREDSVASGTPDVAQTEGSRMERTTDCQVNHLKWMLGGSMACAEQEVIALLIMVAPWCVFTTRCDGPSFLYENCS